MTHRNMARDGPALHDRGRADAWTVAGVTQVDRTKTRIPEIPTVRGHVQSSATMRVPSVLRVRTRLPDGSEGLGEGTTTGAQGYGAENPEGIRSVFDTSIAPAPLGRDADDANGAISATDRLDKGNRVARAAIEVALRGGLGCRLGVPVAQLFGGNVHRRLPTGGTLDLEQPENGHRQGPRGDRGRRRLDIFHQMTGKREVA